MEIVKFKREQEQHMAHIDRIRHMRPVLDSTPPESLGLNHLAYRPKKMQLIEDRRQVVAKENAKLMGLMTKIMNDKREQPKYEKPQSLNEVERKRAVDRLNFENQLMAQRLKKVNSVIDNSELEKDFKRHAKAEANLRRRQMKPLSLPKDLHPHSPLRRTESSLDGSAGSVGGIGSGLFDADLYTSQRGQYLNSIAIDESHDGAIRSVADFRKQVITKKRKSTPTEHDTQLPPLQHPPGQIMNRNESLYELSHSP